MKRIILALTLIAFGTNSYALQITYSEHIAPIIYANCTYCHHQGAIAPFTLVSYSDVYNQRASIRTAVDQRIMPPWPPDIKYSRLSHERILSSSQIDMIKTWVDNGAPRGDSTKEPALPIYKTNTQLPSVDLSKTIPTYTVSSTTDDYRCFAIPSGLTTDKILTALEFLPANRKAVHHILLYYDLSGQCAALDKADSKPGYAGFGGVGSNSAVLVGGWVPGASPTLLPSGMGVTIPKGADLVLQIHYAPGNKGEMDSSMFNIQFSSNTGLREVYQEAALNHFNTMVNGPLIIPANKTKSFTEEYTIPVDVTLIGIAPHMHLIGKTIKSYAVDKKGDTTQLININNWNFHWQGFYQYRKTIVLKAGTKVYAEAEYDNTSNNTSNPNYPPKTVTAGESTTNEMMLVFFSYLVYQSGDENIVLDTSALISGIKNEIQTTNDNSLLKIFPNPATENIHLNFTLTHNSMSKVSVYNMQGQEVISKNMNFNSGNQSIPLSTSGLPAGTYLCRIITQEGVLTQRLTLMKD